MHKIFVTLVLVLLIQSMFGREEQYSNEAEGLYASQTLTVSDAYYSYYSNINWFSTNSDANLENIVKLEVDPHLWSYEEQYNLRVVLQANTYDETGVYLGYDKFELSISHDPDATTSSDAYLSYKKISKPGYRMDVQVLEVWKGSTQLTSSDIVNNIRLRGEINLDRYYIYSNTSYVSGMHAVDNGNGKEIRFGWQFDPVYDFYDLEWVFVSSLSGEYNTTTQSYATLANSDLYFSYRNNNNRVRVSQPSYEIPHVYGQGYLLFRVRGVHEDAHGNLLYSPWSMGDNIDFSGDPVYSMADVLAGNFGPQNGTSFSSLYVNGQSYVAIQSSHEDDKSWQMVSTYAEEGKRKDVISYYDGSMRSRQMVTRMSTSGDIIVGETVYDYEGRPAVNMLPAPAEDDRLKFYESFNKSDLGLPYNWESFDMDASACNLGIRALSTTSGAGKYYSSNWTNHEGAQAYVPVADGYPFTMTEYEADNTGRIRRQSGVGETHAFSDVGGNAGHETKYFYATPTQSELDRLFGSEVGNALHYKKNVVVDANGQGSVSYLDPAGRVIATAIVGGSADNVEPLTSMSSFTQQEDLTQYNKFVDGNSLLIARDFVVTKPTNSYSFYYAMGSTEYNPGCGDLCLDGAYKVDLHLYDECGNDVLADLNYSSINGSLDGKKIGGDANPTACVSGGTDETLQRNVVLTDLPIGKYRLVKRLQVDMDYLDTYWEAYKASECVENLDVLYRYFEENLNLAGCNVDCESCIALLPDAEQRDELGMSEEEYNALVVACNELCEEFTSPCEAIFETMKMDVSPGGQYAEFDFDANGNLICNDKHSLFYETTTMEAKWRKIEIFDADGNPYVITRVNGWPSCNGCSDPNGQMLPMEIADPRDYVQLFDEEWADDIAKSFHPERNYYTWCDDLDNASEHTGGSTAIASHSDGYLEELLKANTYAQAVSKGFIPSTNYYSGGGSVQWNTTQFQQLCNKDPFFSSSFGTYQWMSGNAVFNAKNLMLGALNKYSENAQGVSLNIYEAAAVTVLAPTYYNANSGTKPATTYLNFGNGASTADKDLMWQRLRDMYISKRHGLQFFTAYFHLINNNLPCAPAKGKEARVYNKSKDDIDGDIEGNGGDLSVITDRNNQFADMYHYKNTGQCPIPRDLEQLMNEALEQHNHGNYPFTLDVSTNPSLSPLLVNKLMSGTAFPNFTVHGSKSGNNLILDLKQGSNLKVRFTITDYFVHEVSNVSSIERLSLWREFSNATSSGTFKVSAIKNYDINLNKPSEAVVLNAQFSNAVSALNFTGCSTAFDDYCVPNIAGKHLEKLLKTLLDGTGEGVRFHQNNTILSLDEFTNDLREPVDVYYYNNGATSNWYWKYDGSYKIESSSGASNGSYELNFNGYGFDFAEYLYTIESLIPRVGSSGSAALFDLVIRSVNKNTGEQVIELVPDCEIITKNVSNPAFLPISMCSDAALCSNDRQMKRERIEHFLTSLSTNADIPSSGVNTRSQIDKDPRLSQTLVDELGFGSTDLTISIVSPQVTPSVFDELEFRFINQGGTQNQSEAAYIILRPMYPGSVSYHTIQSFEHLTVESRQNKELEISVLAHMSNGSEVYLSGETNLDFANCKQCFDEGANQLLVDEHFDGATYSLQGSINSSPITTPGLLCDLFTSTNMYRRGSGINTSSVSNGELVVYDHDDPGNGAVAVFGASTQIEETAIWQKTSVGVSNNAEYIMSFWYCRVGDSYVPGDRLELQVGTAHSNGFDFGAQGEWRYGEMRWYSDQANSVDLRINGISTVTNKLIGFEFAIDDIKFHRAGCEGEIAEPHPMLPPFYYENNCEKEMTKLAEFNSDVQYEQYLQDMHIDFRQKYIAALINAAKTNEFCLLGSEETEYHYTLYYYDQAGNLRRTVPPKGVSPLSSTEQSGAKSDRVNGRTGSSKTVSTDHSFTSTYEYNSLNQLVTQVTPDGGETSFFYDKLGRLRFSINAQQKIDERLSYTKYDALGRIIEVGESGQMEALSYIDHLGSDGAHDYPNAQCSEVVRTYYDAYNVASPGLSDGHLRSRVAEVTMDMNPYDGKDVDHRTLYAYDIHGNVRTLKNVNRYMTNSNAAYDEVENKVGYEYDLVSGNVNKVKYQEGEQDQFFHKYEYDADNRIVSAFTSTDNRYWDRDAHYDYYAHGPLARVEIGGEVVQGIDYAYTLQGWLKGVNSDALTSTNDMGRDGKQDDGATGSYLSYNPNAHGHVPEDVFGYSLGYFEGDYKSSGGGADFLSGRPGDLFATDGVYSLYNGNISHMVTTIKTPEGEVLPQLAAYNYDQLNRLAQMRSYEGGKLSSNVWGAGMSFNYGTEYTYDANGNIQCLKRKDSKGVQMDDLVYAYGTDNNQLLNVRESGNARPDIDGDFEGISNYTYDKIGNLTADDGADKIKKISWSVSGKVLAVERYTGSTQPDMEFAYDAMGNRVIKTLKYRNASGLTGETKTYFYNRDAQGNVLATYTNEYRDDKVHGVYLQDYALYGSSRLGLMQIAKKVVDLVLPTAAIQTHYRGQKAYELTNHLGNVLATVSDRLKENRGDAMEFDGVDDVVTIPNTSNLQVTGDMTVEFWIRPDNFNSRQNPVSKTYGGEFAITQELNGTLTMYYGPSGTNTTPYQTCKSLQAVTLNKWNHVAFVRDLTNSKINIYINGNLTNSFTPSHNVVASSSLPITIGDGYAGNYDGEIDEVRIWNVARSAAQIKSNKNRSLKGNEAGLAAYWNFDNQNGQVVYDRSSNSSNGYLGTSSSAQGNDPIALATSQLIGSFDAEVLSYSDYYPFGMEMPDRKRASSGYKYGFNGMEKDDEMRGEGNSYDFGARIYNSRLGRFLKVDPESNKLPSISPYSFAANSPISMIDLHGRNPTLVIWASQSDDGSGTTRIGHAGIVVKNYREVKTTVTKTRLTTLNDGTVDYETYTEVETSYVATGTYTYYDLWPGSSANMTDPTTDVPAAYNQSIHTFNSQADLISYLETNDISGGEGYVADGLVEIEMTPEKEYQLEQKLKSIAVANQDYNAESNNCSGYVSDALNSVGLKIEKEWSMFFVAGVLQGNGWYHEFHTPNNTYNTVVDQNKFKTTVHKDASDKTDEDYEDAVVDPTIKETVKN